MSTSVVMPGFTMSVLLLALCELSKLRHWMLLYLSCIIRKKTHRERLLAVSSHFVHDRENQHSGYDVDEVGASATQPEHRSRQMALW